MNRYILVLGFIVVSCVLVKGQTKKILFLGNSYTAANNLPESVSYLASSLGDSVYFDSNTPGGYRLVDHINNSTTLAKISQQDWDFVVLQAQSQEPSKHPSQVATEVLPYASILNDLIKSNNACTETVFYMTWGRKYGDAQNCATWPPVCTFIGMQERLMTGYMTMAVQNESTVAPVGLTWKHSMDNDPDSLINLYSGDNSHPSLSGTYLTACVMYATMFQKSPVGANYAPGLSENDALFLQQMAEDVVLNEAYNFDFYDTFTNINYELDWKSWFYSGNIAIAGFSIVGLDNTFNFIDKSLNSQNYFWEFGDGYTSTVQNPQHTYEEVGDYVVKQSITNLCFEDEFTDTVHIVLSSSHEVKNETKLSIYPNPGTGIYYLNINTQAKFNIIIYKVFNIIGELVIGDTVYSYSKPISNQINLSNVEKGLYYLQIQLDEETITKTLIVQ